MVEPIFVKTIHEYHSYRDFWRLVELSGFKIIYENELDITKDGVYIIAPMNGNFEEHMVGDLEHFKSTREITGGQLKLQAESGLQRRAHIIWWNLERPSGQGTGSVRQYGKNCFEWIYYRLVDEVWVSDPAMADETQLRYVTLGSDPGLGELSDQMNYNIVHMSAINPRRTTIYKHFNQDEIGPNSWGDKRHDVLKRSKFAINVHQDNYPFCEPLRFALFAAYGLPIISEFFLNKNPYGEDIITFPYHDLVAGIKTAFSNDYNEWKTRGMALHKKLCYDLQFGKVVRKAVNVEGIGVDWR